MDAVILTDSLISNFNFKEWELEPTTILLSLALLVVGPLRTPQRELRDTSSLRRACIMYAVTTRARCYGYVHTYMSSVPRREGQGMRARLCANCNGSFRASRLLDIARRQAIPLLPPPLPPPPSDKYLLTQRLHLKQGPAQAATSLPCPSPSPPSAASATVPCCTLP